MARKRKKRRRRKPDRDLSSAGLDDAVEQGMKLAKAEDEALERKPDKYGEDEGVEDVLYDY